MVFGNGKQGELPLHKRIMSVFVLGIVLVLCAPAVKAYGEPVLAVSTDQMEDLSSLAVSKRLGIVVGCSRILPVDGVVRVAVADPNIVDVLVVSKTELIVNGKSLGRTTLYVWDSTGCTGYDVRVLEDNEELLREISEVIGLPEVMVRFAGSTLLLEGICQTDDEYERADKIGRAYSDNVLNMITVLRPAIAPSFPEPDPSEIEASMGIDGVAVRVVKDAVILEGTVDRESDAERAESFAKLFSQKVLNFIDVVVPPPLEDDGDENDGQEAQVSPDELTPGFEAAGTDVKADETEALLYETPDEKDSDEELKSKIVDALRDPNIGVMVVDGTALLEGEVIDEYSKVRAEAVAKLYTEKVVNIIRVAEEPPADPPETAPPLSEMPEPAPEVTLEDLVREYIGLSEVVVRSVDGKLLLEGYVESQNDLERVNRIASLFSQDVVNLVEIKNPLQVLLQVQVVEVNSGALKNLGISWGSLIDGALSVGSFMFGEWTSALRLEDGNAKGASPEDVWQVRLPLDGILGELWRLSPIRVVLDTLVSQDLASILAAPSLLTVSGKEANFLVGGEIPVYMGQADGRVIFEWRPYGVKLKMLPVVDANGRIVLDLEPEVSSLDWSNALDIGGATVPALRMRKASTHLIVEDNVTIAVGGLIQNTEAKIVRKLPILGDLPILGPLFRSERFEKGETELIILITPRIVKVGEIVTGEDILGEEMPDGDRPSHDIREYPKPVCVGSEENERILH